MFIMGISTYSALIFSFLSFLVAIPSAIKVFNWSATMYKGSIALGHADALCDGLHRTVHHRRSYRIVPGLAGHGHHVNETYFIVAHFHYVMVGGMVHRIPGGIAFLVA